MIDRSLSVHPPQRGNPSLTLAVPATEYTNLDLKLTPCPAYIPSSMQGSGLDGTSGHNL